MKFVSSHFVSSLALAALLLIAPLAPAFADGAAAPLVTVPAAANDLTKVGTVVLPATATAPAAAATVVTVPIGDWTDKIVPAIDTILAGLITSAVAFAFRKLPAAIGSRFTADQIKQVDDLAIHAAQFGLNTIAADIQGKTINIDVGNAVAATGLQFFVNHAPEWMLDFAGGEKGIEEKIFARLPVSGATAIGAAPIAATAPATVVVTPRASA